MRKVRVCVLTGYGINCDMETQFAFNLAGADARRIHINELLDGSNSLSDFHILAISGGFAHGDFLGAGNALALKLRTKLHDQIRDFVIAKKPIIGICNGFQVLVRSGLLPWLDRDKSGPHAVLLHNKRGRFEDRWVAHVFEENSPCIWTKGLGTMELPVRHGEGRFYMDPELLEKVESQRLVVVRYGRCSGNLAMGEYPHNPNGSLNDIAGITDPSGTIFGLMPHPEAFLHYTNHPLWTRVKETARRAGLWLEGDVGASELFEHTGLEIFRNAVNYVEDTL